jgi:amino acid transporter
LLALGAVFSIGGNCSASMLSAPRMTYALAQLGTMPAWFGRVHPRFHTPVNSIIFYSAVALVLALSGSFIWLAVVSTLARLLSYMLSIAALPVLEKRMEVNEDQFRLRGGLLVPGVALVLCLWLITHASAAHWMTTAGFFALGTVFYWLSARRQTSNDDAKGI